MSDCPDPETIAAFAENSLDARESAEVEAHLAECEFCRRRLAFVVKHEKPE